MAALYSTVHSLKDVTAKALPLDAKPDGELGPKQIAPSAARFVRKHLSTIDM